MVGDGRTIAPRGRRQVHEEAIVAVDRLLLTEPLVTLRAAAARTGVSRDTVWRRRRALAHAGQLTILSHRVPPGKTSSPLGIARNQARFAPLIAKAASEGRWPHRKYHRRYHLSVTVRVAFDGSSWEFDLPFIGPLVDSDAAWRQLVTAAMDRFPERLLARIKSDPTFVKALVGPAGQPRRHSRHQPRERR